MTVHSPLLLDVAGTQLSADDRRRLAHPLTGGVILFTRNWRDRAQLLELTSAIKAVREDLLVCVDHEGGTCFMHALTQCDGVYPRMFTENSCKHRTGPQ